MPRFGKSSGKLIRSALEPIAAQIGVNYDLTVYQSPGPKRPRALEGCRCGLNLLMDFTYADGWSDEHAGLGTSQKEARRAAKYVRSAPHCR
jgi:hypothetical protein